MAAPETSDPMSRRFVLLDRDGTLIAERHYLSRPEQVELLPGAIEGLRAMQALGLGLAVVTNQSGLGRGYFDVTDLDAVHRRLGRLLAQRGVRLDGIYVCPHTPDDGCDCRKPHPGLALAAAQELGFDPAAAFVIGDKVCDIELGRRLGAVSLLVQTGYGSDYPHAGAWSKATPEEKPDFVVEDLADAARVIGTLVKKRSYDNLVPSSVVENAHGLLDG
jgi:D-glycero-D-manno-heptose 1,7-bisphosphate phosphatase